MERTDDAKDWTEKRNQGRRESDRSVCMWHDTCHETVAAIKQNCMDNIKSHKEEHERMEKECNILGVSKLDWKVFVLFSGGMVSIGIAIIFFVAPLFINMSETVTRIATNQAHLMQEFNIPVKK